MPPVFIIVQLSSIAAAIPTADSGSSRQLQLA